MLRNDGKIKGKLQTSGQDCKVATAVKRFRNKLKTNKQMYHNYVQGFAAVFSNPLQTYARYDATV